MTPQLKLIGFLGTVLIWAALGFAILREPQRQEDAQRALMEAAVEDGAVLYAENCAACHGASGEGLGSNPALNNAALRSMAYNDLYKTIDRGRYGTTMAAFGIEEGGIFTSHQIDNLITLIQHGSWTYVEQRVAELGRTPPKPIQVEVSMEMVAQVEELANGDVLALGLNTYATHCAACHGANGEGSSVAPPINTAAIREMQTEADLERIIRQGVAGTIMAGWEAVLSDEEIAAAVEFLRRWDEISASGVAMPTIETPPLDMSPEAIAHGQALFKTLCTQCHGLNGYGTPLAPALNSQQFLNNTPDAAIQQIISLGVPNTSMPGWAGYLAEADIQAIVAFLRSLEPTAPAIANPQGGQGQGQGQGNGQGGPPWSR